MKRETKSKNRGEVCFSKPSFLGNGRNKKGGQMKKNGFFIENIQKETKFAVVTKM